MSQGALGFSSSWTELHTDYYGDPVPSRLAAPDEMIALAAVVRDHPGTLLEFAPALGSWEQRHVDVMTEMSLAADRHVNWNVLRAERGGSSEGKPYERPLLLASEAAAKGAAIVALATTEPLTARVSIASAVAFDTLPGWGETMKLPIPARMRALASPDCRAELERALEEGRSQLNWIQVALADWANLTVTVAFTPQNAPLVGRTVGEIASERGVRPFDAFLDISLADELRTYFTMPAVGDDAASWDARARLWRDRRTIVGGSDSGAHLDAICGASVTTSLFSEGVRRRELLSVEEAVHHLTEAPARLYGLRQRGRVQEGYFADLVVFDPDRIGPGEMSLRTDLPEGAARLYCDAQGIDGVFVNGSEIIHDNEFTGERPGTVLRSGRDTETVRAATLARDLV